MDDLIAFVEARLDEDERKAPVAGGFAWRSGYPADRLLREVEAKRAILAEHQPAPPPKYGSDIPRCAACLTDRNGWNEDWKADPWPCATGRHLAAVWSDHPDYRDEWKP